MTIFISILLRINLSSTELVFELAREISDLSKVISNIYFIRSILFGNKLSLYEWAGEKLIEKMSKELRSPL